MQIGGILIMSIKNIGRDIKALRTKRKIGSRELSRLIGKAETYISQLERGLIKKPDFDTAFAIMQNLGWDEENIEEFLSNFYQINSPERNSAEEMQPNWYEERAAEIEEMWIKKNDQGFSANMFESDIKNFQSQWMLDLYERLESKNEEIQKELSFNIDKNAQTFETVINNLHSLLTSMRDDRGNFNFFVSLFEKDLTILNEESKNNILKTVRGETERHIQNYEQE